MCSVFNCWHILDLYANDNPSKSLLGKYSLGEVMINNNIVKISLKNGIKDLLETSRDGIFEISGGGIEYSSSREAYINKSQLVWFNIDEEKMTIAMSFGDVRSTLQFPDHGGEFQRIKRELTR